MSGSGAVSVSVFVVSPHVLLKRGCLCVSACALTAKYLQPKYVIGMCNCALRWRETVCLAGGKGAYGVSRDILLIIREGVPCTASYLCK